MPSRPTAASSSSCRARRSAARRRSASISRPSTAMPPISSAARALGVTIGVVVGGGNVLRGVESRGAGRVARRPPTPWACWRP